MITLSDIHSARTRLQGITTRTHLIELDHADTTAASSSNPKTSNPSALSNCAEPTTKSPPSRKKKESAASSPTPAAITPRASPTPPARSA